VEFHPEFTSDGFPLSGGVKQGWSDEIKLFSSFMRRYLENGTRSIQSYYKRLIGSYAYALSIGIMIDDLELLNLGGNNG